MKSKQQFEKKPPKNLVCSFFLSIFAILQRNYQLLHLILTTMAEKSKKQLIYKDYSAVNTNGSPLNVDMTESTNLLGGEIWYN